MKKIFYILSICVMTILQPSCDALDLAPEDYYGAGNFWKEASQPKAFMLGLHAQLRSYYDMFYTLGELRGGTQRVGTSSLNTSLNYADIRSQNISEDIPGISNWNGLYSPIMQVNHFIQEVENGCTFLDDATRSRYLGQAYAPHPKPRWNLSKQILINPKTISEITPPLMHTTGHAMPL